MSDQELETTTDVTDNPDVEELSDDDLEDVAGGWTGDDGG